MHVEKHVMVLHWTLEDVKQVSQQLERLDDYASKPKQETPVHLEFHGLGQIKWGFPPASSSSSGSGARTSGRNKAPRFHYFSVVFEKINAILSTQDVVSINLGETSWTFPPLDDEGYVDIEPLDSTMYADFLILLYIKGTKSYYWEQKKLFHPTLGLDRGRRP